MKQPFRIVLCQLLNDGISYTPQDFYDILLPDYRSESQLTLNAIDSHLQSLRAVGIIAVDSEWLEADNLVQKWKLTPYGKERLRKML